MNIKIKFKSAILHGFSFANQIFRYKTLVPYMLCKRFYRVHGLTHYLDHDPKPDGVGNLHIHKWPTVDLSYTLFEPARMKTNDAIIIIHGMLGIKENWKSVAIRLCRNTGRNVFTVDLRNHGTSPRHRKFGYPYLAADVYQVMKKHGLEKYKNTILGHSLGGRTAMTIALDQPQMVYDIVIVDITPISTYPQPYFWKEFLRLADGLIVPSHLNLVDARKVAEKEFRRRMESRFIRSFIRSNLYRDEQEKRYKWKVNIRAIERALPNLLHMPVFDTPFKGPSLFISGERSNYINDRNVKQTRAVFPNSTFEIYRRSGHAVHEDQAEEFFLTVEEFVINMRWLKEARKTIKEQNESQ